MIHAMHALDEGVDQGANNYHRQIDVTPSSSSSLLELRPIRRFRNDNDDFFELGNRERANTYVMMLEVGSESCRDDELLLCDEIRCHYPSCRSLIFRSLKEYESHYNSSHRHQCSQCNVTLPSERFLSIHISETHDSFFRTAADRGALCYVCYVDGCDRLCKSHAERRRHLIQDHLYPTTFDFNFVHKVKQGKGNGGIKLKTNSIKSKAAATAKPEKGKGLSDSLESGQQQVDDRQMEHRPRRMQVDGRQQVVICNDAPADEILQRTSNSDQQEHMDNDNEMEIEREELNPLRDHTTGKRGSSTPCKYWVTKGYCRAGAGCRFVHENSARGSSKKHTGSSSNSTSINHHIDHAHKTKSFNVVIDGQHTTAAAGVGSNDDTDISGNANDNMIVNDGDDDDDDVDALSSSLSRVRVSVPTHISFGRRGRGRGPGGYR